MKVYTEEILEKHVKSWLDRGDDFVLEEDRDSGHGIGSKSKNVKDNIVQNWKKKNGLESYFNMSGSPDLAMIENCWQPMKAHMRKFTHWDEFETYELACEGWYEKVTQEFINKRVLAMPARLQAVIDAKGKMTGY